MTSKGQTTSDIETPLVSVIVAAFNAADYIEETCRSALAQTYPALELIVVDDGSTDATSDVVGELQRSDPRVRLIRQENQGVAAARNAAIAAAAGEFIAPLDADDLWAPEKIARQVACLRASAPQVGFAYCWWTWIDLAGRVLDRAPRWQVEGRVLENLVEVNFTGNASVPLFRRSCIDQIGGYDASLRQKGAQGCEDWDLVLRVAERYSVAVVPAVLVGYRRRTDGMSTACDTMWRSRVQVIDALTTRQPQLPSTVLTRSAAQFALHLAGVAFWSGRFVQACRWGLRARPFDAALSVMPHMARILARRLSWRKMPPRAVDASLMFDETRLPEPLIPYHQIYGRRWRALSTKRE